MFSIFLDDYHVRDLNSMSVRRPLSDFIQRQLGPADLVSIMHPLTPLDAVQFTRNHSAILEEIGVFEGRKGKYEARNTFEESYQYYPTTIVEMIRNQVSLSGLKALVTHLGGVREGRKSLILVSEGYSNYVPPSMRDSSAALPGPRSLFGQSSRSPLEQTAQAWADMDINLELRQIFDLANRNNTAIYALDPRGLTAFEYGLDVGVVDSRTDAQMLTSTQNSLRILAEQTDGRAIVNQNDLETGLRQVVRDSSVYYLIGYTSTQEPNDGEFHEIKVNIKREGIRVRARKGYWAITPEDAERIERPTPERASDVDAAFAAIAAPSRGRLVSTWVGTEPSENGKTRVTFVWEVNSTPGRPPSEVARVALTAAGENGGAYFRGDVPDGPARLSGNAELPRSATVSFEAEPGTMHLSVAVEARGGGVLDRDMKELTVPALSTIDVGISTPMVFRARNALEMRSLKTDLEAVPSAGRTFQRSEQLLVRFKAYAPGTAVPVTVGRLLNRAGESDVGRRGPIGAGRRRAPVRAAARPPRARRLPDRDLCVDRRGLDQGARRLQAPIVKQHR